MSETISLPIPIPNLTRLHTLNEIDTIVADLNTFLEDHPSLIVLGNFEDSKILLENAHNLCIEDGAHPKQRVLWINDIDKMAALKDKLEKGLKESFPEREIDINNIRAFSVVPQTQKIAYLIYIDPSLSPNPKDKRKKLSTFQMARAFKAAIKEISTTPDPTHSKS